jgi:hypothetical protein
MQTRTPAAKVVIGGLELDFEAFVSGAHAGEILRCVFHDGIDAGVGMVGIVMEEDELLGAAFHGDADGFAPMAVSPAAAGRFILFGKILRIVDKYVGAFSELAHVLVKQVVARFVIGGIDQHSFRSLDTESEAALRMMEPFRLQGAVIELHLAFFDAEELAFRGHLAHVHREVGIGHLAFDRVLQAAIAAGGMEVERVPVVLVERAEERDTLDVVPMEMRDEDVRLYGRLGRVRELGEMLAENTKSGTAVENEQTAGDAYLDAGGVAAVPKVLFLRSWRRTAYSPEFHMHRVC